METEDEPFRVGAFLDMLNESFVGMRVSIRGEVSGVEERRGVTYFSLKDSEEEGMLSCLIFRSDFFLQGIRLEDGQEVIVEGTPNVWKPRGRLSFRVSVVRLAGEGSLKKAYDALRRTLEREGLFSIERKRMLPLFPKRIALLTSREGAAIGDFMTNIGRHGFSVTLFDAHVEGKRAIAELIEGIRYFNARNDRFDVLVMIRGGGSLESLEAYNSEGLVREVSASSIPVLAGIGHEKDIPLAALAAEYMVSTPTAAALALGVSWEGAGERLRALEYAIFERFQREIFDAEERLRFGADIFQVAKGAILVPFQNMERLYDGITAMFSNWFDRSRMRESHVRQTIFRSFDPSFLYRHLASLESRIASGNPSRLLERGYSILLKNGRVLRSVADVSLGESLDAILSDGAIRTKALSIKKSL